MIFVLTVLGVRFGLWASGVRISVHGLEHLDEAREHGIVGEAIIGADSTSLSIETHYLKLRKLLPNIQFMNKVAESNQAKSSMA